MKINDALKLHPESEILLSHVLEKDKAWVFANQGVNLTTKQTNKLSALIKKREVGWPIAYLTGEKEFYGLSFFVNPDVLIPRPETELLVELALKAIGDKRLAIRNVIDIGTGSGNIILSIAKNAKSNFNFIATDISDKALAVAKQNAKRHGVAAKIKFLHGNLLKPIDDSKFIIHNSIFLANLPYLTDGQLNNPTIKNEPKLALEAGPDGLKYYRELFEQLAHVIATPHLMRGKQSQKDRQGLRPRDNQFNLVLLLEHDPAQKTALGKLAEQYFPEANILSHKDLTDKWRVLEIKIN